MGADLDGDFNIDFAFAGGFGGSGGCWRPLRKGARFTFG
jgi:hypothetical protein